MKKIYYLTILFLFLASTAFAVTQNKIPLDPAKEKEIKSRIGTLQIPFIKNESQIKDSKVKFYANTFAGTVLITDNEIVYGLKGWAVKERFLNAQNTKAEGINATETKVSYFQGSDSNNWRGNIPTYNEIYLGKVYKNIRLNLKAYGRNVEKLFIVEKGGKPEDVAIKVEGTKGLKVNDKGELEIETGMGTVKMTKPVAWQKIDGKRIEIPVSYNTQLSAGIGQQSDSDTPHSVFVYGFTVGDYDRSRSLVIDPLLASTYLGGGDYDSAYFMALDSSGNVYVTGETSSSKFPATVGAYDSTYNDNDVFISKLSPDLSTLLASTFLGAGDIDSASYIAIDQSGNVYITGWTFSENFPTTETAFDPKFNSTAFRDAFIAKLSPDLSTLLASTFLGGKYGDLGFSLALDKSGNVYVTGWTFSENFPTTETAFDPKFNSTAFRDAFIAKLSPDLSTLLASTFLGGGDSDWVYAIAIGSAGDIYVTGGTYSDNFPVTVGAYDSTHNDGSDVFISKLSPDLSTLLASTFLGAGDGDWAYAIAIGSAGDIYVTGGTHSNSFPVTVDAYDSTYNDESDVFISKLSPDLSTLFASTFLGGGDNDEAYAMAIGLAGDIYVTGLTGSTNFPTTQDAYSTASGGGKDVFISTLDANLSAYIPPCTYSIDLLQQSFSPNGGSGSVNVTAQSGCAWTATSNDSWIMITAGSSGTGNGIVNYSVSANTNTSSRTGTLTIAGQTFTVTQEGNTSSECSTWTEVISKYNDYVSGQAQWNDVIECYNQYASPSQ